MPESGQGAGDETQSHNLTPKKSRPGGRKTQFDYVTATDKFLTSLRRKGNVSLACKAARIARHTAYDWRQSDPEFAAAWDDALKDASEVLEAEGWRRAVTGTLKPVYQAGAQVGTIREYSDTLLIFLLKGANPEKYRERQQVEHSGRVSATVKVEYVNDWRPGSTAPSGETGAASDGE